MSFGWSAGDIAQAIKFITKVVKALDSAEGASQDYREAVAFLSSLHRTLEPLQAFSALNLYPAYGDDIKKQVDSIRKPTAEFLDLVKGFELGLGPNAKQGRHHSIPQKLQWGFVTSKKVDDLRKKISEHMVVLDNLLHRLTLEIAVSVQQNLSGDLKRCFTDVLSPRLVSILQEHLQPLASQTAQHERLAEQRHAADMRDMEEQNGRIRDIQTQIPACRDSLLRSQDAILSNFRRQDRKLDAAVENVKTHITSATSDLQSGVTNITEVLTRCRISPIEDDRMIRLERSLEQLQLGRNNNPARESLSEAYYFAFLYLGCFLRNLYQRLANMVKPKALAAPMLLAKYNITFQDAIGRAPRVLQYDCFRSYKVFQAFLEVTFKDCPGASWIDQGLYQLFNAQSGLSISAETWSRSVSPGSRVNMSMLIDHLSGRISRQSDTCPIPGCSGSLLGVIGVSPKQCSKCEIEVMVADVTQVVGPGITAMPPNAVDEETSSNGRRPAELSPAESSLVRPTDPKSAATSRRPSLKRKLEDNATLSDLYDDLYHFKMVARVPRQISTEHTSEPRTISFLFVVNGVTLNENPKAGGTSPRVDFGGRWLPPISSAGFDQHKPGAMFRWSNGNISVATGYAWDKGSGKSTSGDNVEVYDTSTIFWCNPFYQFSVTPGDASAARDVDMRVEGEDSDEDYDESSIRWHTINFHHDGTLSRIDYSAESQYLAGNQRGFITELGLSSYQCQDGDAPVSGGISGNLAILIGVIAFSCRRQELRHVLINDQAWQGYRWRGHRRQTGRRDGRGKVVSIYLDPDNPGGSTREALHELEWESGHILI